MIQTVTLRYIPGDATEEVLLSGIPRVGDDVRLPTNGAAPTYVVEHVLWQASKAGEPIVIVSVRQRPR